MKIDKIHQLTARLVKEDWFLDDEVEDQERDEFAGVLEDMYNQASEDVNALYAFFLFAVDERNAEYEWDSQEFHTKFRESFRGGGEINEAIRQYFIGYEHAKLAPVALDRELADFFDWTGHIEKHRPDLSVKEYGSTQYLFEGE